MGANEEFNLLPAWLKASRQGRLRRAAFDEFCLALRDGAAASSKSACVWVQDASARLVTDLGCGTCRTPQTKVLHGYSCLLSRRPHANGEWLPDWHRK